MSIELFAEALESRTMLSGTPTAATLQHDRLAIQQAMAQFRVDAAANWSTLLTDLSNINKDDLKRASTITPLVQQFRADIKAMNAALLADRTAESQAVLADESVIAGDRLQLQKDKGNATAVAADRSKLRTDRATLQSDIVTGLNARIATRKAYDTTLFNDGAAIVAAAQSDANGNAALTAALTKWTQDKSAANKTLMADLTALAAAHTQFETDLLAAAAAT